MNPEDWRQLEEIFQAAAELPAAERNAFVESSCGTNTELLHQVKSLLASDSEAAEFIESPIWTDSSFLNTSAKKEFSNSLEHEHLNGDAESLIGTKIGPFRLERELGRGGMGAVYLAERDDGEFRQKVAIKLIKRGMDSDFIIRRFRHERQILASFEHPFIARLLDGGTLENGVPYFVMEYVEGQTLYDYCDSKRMSVRERLKLFQKLCSALEYAHQKQIVHRDIKPSNILINAAGVPKLLDFGIAKVLDPNLIHESVNPTASMMRMMTPDYASPEQVQGVDVTPASDIYSLGILLYELVSGHRPHNFTGRALHEVSYTICEVMPQLPSQAIGSEKLLLARYSKSETDNLAARTAAAADDLRSELAGPIDNIVMKAVAKSPADRYSSVTSLSLDITSFLRGKTLVAPEFKTQTERREPHGLKNLAVLPFKFINLSPEEDTGDKFLGLGLADALITRISKVRHLQVRPTSSTLPFHETFVDPIKAGNELGVEFVLDGNIKKAANRLRVTVQLLNVRENSAIWATSIDEMLSDVLTLEDTLANKVVEALLPQFSVGDLESFAKRGTDVPEAFEHYLRGRYHFNLFTEEGLAKAFLSFHQAIAADPNYALAYTGLADYYNWLGIIGVLPPQECFQPAIIAATKAVKLDEELSEAHASLGFSLHAGNFDWKAAEGHLQRALQLNPSNANGFVWYSIVLYTVGRFNEAINYARRAVELDPLTPFNHHNIGWGLYFARRFDEGIAQYEKVVQDFPNYIFGFYGLSKIHRINGQTENSLAEIDKAVEIMGDSVFTELAKAECLAADGQIDAAGEKLAELERLSQERYVSPYQLALGYVFLARSEPDCSQIHIDKTFSLLEQAFEIQEAWLNWMGVEPAFDVIRGDERFDEMLARTGYDQVLSMNSQIVIESSGGFHDRTTQVIDATDITAGGIRDGRERPNRKILYAAFALLILLGVAGIWFGPNFGGSQEPRSFMQPTSFQNPSLVVLPFSSGDVESQNLGAGFADALSQRFGGIKGIQVVSANTGRVIATPTAVEAARELGVTFVLRGSIEKTGNVFSIEAELVNVLADRGVWKERFSSTDGGIFSLQTQIARRVTDSLNIALLPAEIQRLEKSYTAKPAVYEQYLVGRSQMANRSADGLRMAITNFAASVAADSEFVPGYVGLADSYSLLNLYDIDPPANAYATAKQHAERAISLDNEYAEAHASLAYIRFYSERDREGSELEFRRAIQMNPSYAQARHWFALVLAAMNKPVDAVTEIHTAERLDPKSLAIRSAAAMVYYFDNKYPEALEQCDRALAVDPQFVPALKVKRWTYQAMGHLVSAKQTFVLERNSMGGTSGEPGWQIIESQLAETAEERIQARAMLDEAVNAKEIIGSDFTFAFEIALAFEHLGSRDKALYWLERAERSGNHSFNFLEADPRLAGMQSEPRFLLLAEKLHSSN